MGEAVTASEMKYSWVKRLVEEGVLLDIPQGTRHNYKVSHKDAFWRSLSEIDHRLADLDAAQIPDSWLIAMSPFLAEWEGWKWW